MAAVLLSYFLQEILLQKSLRSYISGARSPITQKSERPTF